MHTSHVNTWANYLSLPVICGGRVAITVCQMVSLNGAWLAMWSVSDGQPTRYMVSHVICFSWSVYKVHGQPCDLFQLVSLQGAWLAMWSVSAGQSTRCMASHVMFQLVSLQGAWLAMWSVSAGQSTRCMASHVIYFSWSAYNVQGQPCDLFQLVSKQGAWLAMWSYWQDLGSSHYFTINAHLNHNSLMLSAVVCVALIAMPLSAQIWWMFPRTFFQTSSLFVGFNCVQRAQSISRLDYNH